MKNGLLKDPVMLLSVINTKLRDEYAALDVLCSDLEISREELEQKLKQIDYAYDPDRNQFV